MIPEICKDCGHPCVSHADCLRWQDYNIVIDDAQQYARLRQQIKVNVPDYKGQNKQWFDKVPMFMENSDKHLTFQQYIDLPDHGYRFITITFDPKKFGFKVLSNPKQCIKFIGNALEELKEYYSKCYLIYETHKSGVIHAHINYTCPDNLSQATFMLRLKYYFAKDLRNKHAINDRIFNNIGLNYMIKDETKVFKRIFMVHDNAKEISSKEEISQTLSQTQII